MRFMLWKKLYFLLISRVRLAFFILLPSLALALMSLLKIETGNYTVNAMVTISCLLNLVIFSIEDILFSEALLAGPLKLRQLWITQGVTNTLIICGWAAINCILYQLIFKQIDIVNFSIQAIISILIVYSFEMMSTLHYSDYSKIKQWIASIFAMLFIAIAMLPFTSTKLAMFNGIGILYFYIAFAIVTLVIAHALFGSGNVEKLLVNTKELTTTSKDHSNLVIE